MKRTESKGELAIHPAHKHGGEAGAIAGEVLGALVGSAAGPPGAVAGMVLGAAVGALAGEMMDEEAERTSLHDAELDETIGVTKGDLGRPSAAPPPPDPEKTSDDE
jgi:uncharacterized membrane protein